MAIYHLSIKIVSRGKGKSVVAAAAYRAGEKIKNEYDGLVSDYTRKSGVVHTEILLHEHAPAEYKERAVLWNAVEKVEKAKNSQLAREIEVALPVELSFIENRSLVRNYVKHNFVSAGMCADICIHDKKDGNPHAHILLTMRPFNSDGTWGDKQKKEYFLDGNGEKVYDKKKKSYKCKSIPATDWNDQDRAEQWRAAWAELTNKYLEKLKHPARIDHRSYERQGVDNIPTIHLGVAASQMEQRGIRTDRGDINRSIEVSNQRLRQLKARIVKLQNWIKEEAANAGPPTLSDMIQEIFSRRAREGKSQQSQSIYNVKDGARMLNFVLRNEITDMAGLDKHFKGMIDKQFDIRDKLRPIDRRLKTLDEHLRQSANYNKAYRGKKAQYEKLYAEYKAIKKAGGFRAESKAQKALNIANEYYKTHRMEITHYEAAERYLKDVLQKHFDTKKLPPITKWKEEKAKLIADRNRIEKDYYVLRDEVKEAEQIRKSVYSIMRQEQRERQPRRTWEMEL